MTPETKQCQNCKQNFQIEEADFAFYEKMKVPPPTFCPECRLQRRLAYRNERAFYKRTCDMCKKPMISIISEETGLTVYCSPCWWSDKWDGMTYGVDFDPAKPFLQQVRDLFQRVPIMNVQGLYTTLVNSEYTHMVGHLKNCYLVTNADFNEDCAYGAHIDHCKDCYDNSMVDGSELSYQNVNCQNCYKINFSVDCESCHDVSFSKNCVGCSDCFGCVNLRNKRYYIFNKPYSKDEYTRLIKEYAPETQLKIDEIRKKALTFWNSYPQKYMHEHHNTNATGDYIYNSKNTFDSYNATEVEDSRYCSIITPGGMKDCWDFTHYGTTSELMYDTFQAGDHASNIRFSWWIVTNTQNVEYSMFLVGCNNMFGSVGLRKKEYCILNKQYTKEDFDKLRAKIIEQMNEMPYKDKKNTSYRYGEFFPVEMSPFGYNETTVHEFFPMSREDALQVGFNWRDPSRRQYDITMRFNDVPDRIQDVKDDILKEVIGCKHEGKCEEQCSTAFRIIPQELEFYRKMNFPLPRFCPNCRHYQRLQYRNPIKFWHRTCTCAGEKSENGVYQNTGSHPSHQKDQPCPNEFETSYAPEREEIVYCEECYQQEVV
jgi:hypothetical protein